MILRHSLRATLLAATFGTLATAGKFDDSTDASPAVSKTFPAPVEAWRPLIAHAILRR